MKTKSTKSKSPKIETPQTEETVIQAVESAPAVSEPQFTDPETNHLVSLLRMNTEEMTEESQLISLRNQIAIMLSDMAMSRAKEIRSKVEVA